jgi:hypothetical protein
LLYRGDICFTAVTCRTSQSVCVWQPLFLSAVATQHTHRKRDGVIERERVEALSTEPGQKLKVTITRVLRGCLFIVVKYIAVMPFNQPSKML